jgi:hypothetical protein
MTVFLLFWVIEADGAISGRSDRASMGRHRRSIEVKIAAGWLAADDETGTIYRISYRSRHPEVVETAPEMGGWLGPVDLVERLRPEHPDRDRRAHGQGGRRQGDRLLPVLAQSQITAE